MKKGGLVMGEVVIVRVAVEQTVYRIDKPYDYLLPKSLLQDNLVGCRVLIPFGNGSATRQGLIIGLTDKCDYPFEKLKTIIAVLDVTPIVNNEMLKLAEWMKKRTFCTYFDALRVLLPTGISLKVDISYSLKDKDVKSNDNDKQSVINLLSNSGVLERNKILNKLGISRESNILEKMCKEGLLLRNDIAVRKIGDATLKMVKLCDSQDNVKLTPKQKIVLDLLEQVGCCAVKELCYFTGVTVGVVNNLANKGLLQIYEQEYYRRPYDSANGSAQNIELTDSQQAVYDGLLIEQQKGYSVNLLYGVTGSGKTQVFLKMVDRVVESGKAVIVMVPEIALTPQTISIFNKRYGNKVAVLHSAMSLGQRMDEWKRIKNGDALVAVGTRSAVFAPLDNIGLIIIDEEQEHTYKSEQTPKFHARDVARFRAKYHSAMLILASATPSVESFTAAKSGRYNLWRLEKRYGKATLPKVTTVDMRTEFFEGSRSSISRKLQEEIENVLDKEQQAILLMNRRGHNTFVSCSECGEVISCPNCSISMNYHSANGRLMCHYCGYSIPNTSKCIKCGGEHLKYLGSGTQRVEEELNEMFPNARILRMDADSTLTKDAYEKNLTAFSRGEYDIMLGTQMVAKGLDFPKVTLVGVLNADRALYSADYRSFERTFSLLTQVVGRSGRGSEGGTAVIQTVTPENNIIKLSAVQDYDAFYEEEILNRKLMIYPPYCDIAMLVVQSTNRSAAEAGINNLFSLIVDNVKSEFNDVKLNILGPSVATVPKVNNKYRYRLIIKFKSFARFSELLDKCLLTYHNSYEGKKTTVSVDINPENII